MAFNPVLDLGQLYGLLNRRWWPAVLCLAFGGCGKTIPRPPRNASAVYASDSATTGYVFSLNLRGRAVLATVRLESVTKFASRDCQYATRFAYYLPDFGLFSMSHASSHN